MQQAFPDSNSIYHVSLMHIGPGDELCISSDALPYARYFRWVSLSIYKQSTQPINCSLQTYKYSFQTYGIPDFLAKASARDVDIVPEGGPNCYANLTAAANGEKQGVGKTKESGV